MLIEIITYLAERLDARVATQRPVDYIGNLVTVVRSGGGGDRFTDRPRLSLHCWAGSDLAALQLAEATAALMLEAPDHIANLARVDQDSFYANPYTDGTPRYTVSVELVTNR